MNHLTYYRPDGVVGVGFEIEHCAKKMHSVSWPDRLAERMLDDEAKRKGIRIEGRGCVAPDKSDAVLQEMLSPDMDDEYLDDLDDEDHSEPIDDDDPEADAEIPDTETEPDLPSETAELDQAEPEPISEAQAIRDYLTENPKAANKEVIAALGEKGIEIISSQVSRQRGNLKDDGVI